MNYVLPMRIVTADFEVGIHEDGLRGWFEHKEEGDECGGGLWFEEQDGKLALIDYDGTFNLPRQVSQALVDAGFIVADEFF